LWRKNKGNTTKKTLLFLRGSKSGDWGEATHHWTWGSLGRGKENESSPKIASGGEGLDEKRFERGLLSQKKRARGLLRYGQTEKARARIVRQKRRGKKGKGGENHPGRVGE